MFRKNILLKIEEVNDNIKGIRSTTSNDSSMFSDNASEDHNEGTEAHEVEKSFLLMSRESDYVTNLQKALHRIDAGTYGICEVYQDDPEKCECRPHFSKIGYNLLRNLTVGKDNTQESSSCDYGKNNGGYCRRFA